ncbi:MAG: tRNA pseudouridine(55) synthase TruB, partial [Actinomycetota bacterium]
LDPDATGVLLVGVGKATRFLSYAQASPKRYEARVRLGASTSTQDASGEVFEQRPVDVGTEQVREALDRFRGEIEQIPPMVSAVRIGGKRLHELARQGVEVERPARKVHIYEIDLIDGPDAMNELGLDVTCSGGTYIRTLAHDLGQVLGCGAHLRSLRRTEAAGFMLSEAVPLDAVGADTLRPMIDAVRDLGSTEVGDSEVALVANGRPLPKPPGMAEGSFTAVVHDGELLGVYRTEADRLVAERVVPR